MWSTMDYIPDITERFPEGFGGVDMTNGYRNDDLFDTEDMPSDYEVTWWDGDKRYASGANTLEEAQELAKQHKGTIRKYNHDTEEWEDWEPYRFKVGQKYTWVDWFTGGCSRYTVKERTDTQVILSEYRTEMDGEYEFTQHYNIHKDDNGEYIVMCQYHDEEGRLYAED